MARAFEECGRVLFEGPVQLLGCGILPLLTLCRSSALCLSDCIHSTWKKNVKKNDKELHMIRLDIHESISPSSDIILYVCGAEVTIGSRLD